MTAWKSADDRHGAIGQALAPPASLLRTIAFFALAGGVATVSFTAIRAQDLALSDGFFLICVLALLAVPPLVLASLRKTAVIATGGALMVIGPMINALWSGEPATAVMGLKYLFATSVLVACFGLVQSRRQWVALLGWFIVGVELNAGVAILQRLRVVDFNRDCEFHLRVCGLTEQPNDLGYLLVAGLFATALFFEMRKPRARYVRLIVAIAPILTALVFTGSLGSVLGLMAGLSLIGLAHARKHPVRALLLMAAIAAGGAGWLTYSSIQSTPDDPIVQTEGTSQKETTVRERIEGYTLALSGLAEQPVLGVGPYSGPRNMVPHNLWLGIWYETGMAGLAGAVLIFSYMIAKLIALLRDQSGHADGESTSVHIALALVVSLMVAAQAAPIGFRRASWVPFWLVMPILIVLPTRQQRRPQAT